MDSATSSPAPSPPPSLRWTVALSVAAFALILILAQAGALLLMFHEKEDELITETVDQQLTHSIEVFRQSGRLSPPGAPDMQLYRTAPGGGGPGGEVPAFLADLPPGDHEIFEGGREFHVSVRLADGDRFILAYDVEDHEQRLGEMTLVTLSAALVMAAATLVLVYFLSSRLTWRLEQLAEAVSSGPAGRPYVQPGMEREILVLAEALESLEARQRALLEREREFTAHLAHELRTPLTAIRTDAEMISTLPALAEAGERRARRIVERVDRMSELAASLLALGREGQARLVETVGLAATLRDAWEPLADRAASRHLRLVQQVPATVLVRCDQSLLELVLRNLLDNAVRHSANGEILCTLDAGTLLVRDCGPGIAEADLPRIFDRHFHAGAHAGYGLGLALVRHACLTAGWSVSAANAAGGGAEFRVDLDGSLLA